MLLSPPQLLSIAELIHPPVPLSLRDVATVSGLSKEDLTLKFSCADYSVMDVLLVVICAELLMGRLPKRSVNCEFHTFGQGLKLLHKIVHHSKLTISDIAAICETFAEGLSKPDEGLDDRVEKTHNCYTDIISTLMGGEVTSKSASDEFMKCVREVTRVS